MDSLTRIPVILHMQSPEAQWPTEEYSLAASTQKRYCENYNPDIMFGAVLRTVDELV